jgi:hypothetical protein
MNVRLRPSAGKVARSAAVEVASLERRIMMCADGDEMLNLPDNMGSYPAVEEQATVKAPTTLASGSSAAVAASLPLSSVPVLNSRPGAFAKLYLDFTGDTTSTWGTYRPGTTPAYDSDGDPTTFSDAEVASIRQIFDRVAEKYSPYNINVTTVDPRNLNNNETAKVVIGGGGAWLGQAAGGIAYVGGFNNSSSNVAFVFPNNLGNGYAQYVGEAIAHESGHLFGLQHQSSYDAQGNKTSEYAAANAAGDAPIMGNSYLARRGLWWYGTSSVAATAIQDDMSVISSNSNGFGYRADDYGGTIPTASALTLSGTTAVSGAGVIERTTDTDMFSFVSGGGSVSLSVNPSTAGGMLDAKIDLRDANGTVLATSDNGLAESINATVTGGTYYLTVASHGGYGDVGQYTISGTVQQVTPPPPVVPNAPSSLTAVELTTSSLRLSWTDSSTDQTGFKIYASRDGNTWMLLGTVGADVTTVDNSGLRRNATYYYKVQAYNAVGDSADSNVTSARTALNATTALAGDLNLDGVVDFLDLAMMSQDYNKPVSTAALGDANLAWQQGDLNNDGVVDFNDMAIMAQNYNTGQLLTSDAPDDGASFGALTPVIPSANTTTATVAAALVSTTSNTTTTPAKTKAPRPIHKPTAFSLKLVARPRTVHPVAVVRKV